MRSEIFLDCLDNGAAILGNLLDFHAVHQPKAKVGMAKALDGFVRRILQKCRCDPVKRGNRSIVFADNEGR
jgi:hypothetical protein